MKKIILVFFASLLFFLVCPYLGSAEMGMNIEEVGPDYIEGTYLGQGPLYVSTGGKVIGTGEVVNQKYHIRLDHVISPGTELIVTGEGTNQQIKAVYQPVLLNKVDDQMQILTGSLAGAGNISASVDGQMLNLKNLNNGNFEFSPSSLLTYGKVMKVVSENNGVKSITTDKVVAAPAPTKPLVDSLSNKQNAITGMAEPNSFVAIIIKKNTYKTKVNPNGQFKFDLPSKKPLSAGTTVSVYVIAARHNWRSETASIKVLDLIPPTSPTIDKITNKSIRISGKAEPFSTIIVLRNSKAFKTVKTSKEGIFFIGMPLQQANTKFEFYAEDAAGNKGSKTTIVVTHQKRPSAKLMSAPVIRQMPELPRGCEVTSLSMLLKYAGVKADKMILARQVTKDTTPFKIVNGKIHFGNPHKGFVGDMYSFSNPGFGVFHRPIEDLAKTYLPERIVNLSGQSFDSVLDYVAAGRPVWVINTSTFSYVPGSYWQTWYTPQGIVRVTMKEHSVLVTGFDSKYVYFNDPLDGKKNKKHPKKHFIEGWNQFGKQAISYF